MEGGFSLEWNGEDWGRGETDGAVGRVGGADSGFCDGELGEEVGGAGGVNFHF